MTAPRPSSAPPGSELLHLDRGVLVERVRAAEERASAAEKRASAAEERASAAEEELAQLRARLKSLEALVAKLQAQVSLHSGNSHQPPSSDGPRFSTRRKKSKSKGKKRKKGGQPGHKGVTRRLVPEAEVSSFQDLVPTACGCCGEGLSGVDQAPQRHQVVDIPPIEPEIIEYRLHALLCPACGKHTRAELPAGVPRRCFGPRLHALVVLLTGSYRLSRRNARRLVQDAFGIDLSIGTISALEQDASTALQVPMEELLAAARAQPVIYIDETSWWEGNVRAWLWGLVSSLVTVFLIRPWRGAEGAVELLGADFSGIVVSDRWSGYLWLDTERRQLCHAHLARDFVYMSERSGPMAAIGKKLITLQKKLFRLWYRVRDGTLDRESFAERVVPIRAEMKELLAAGAACDSKEKRTKASGMCRSILKLEAAMWTFVRVEGVEPSNNDAERALRSGVIWRGTSFGTQSIAGSTYVERMLSIAATCRQHGRRLLPYLVEVIHARHRREIPPPVIPALG